MFKFLKEVTTLLVDTFVSSFSRLIVCSIINIVYMQTDITAISILGALENTNNNRGQSSFLIGMKFGEQRFSASFRVSPFGAVCSFLDFILYDASILLQNLGGNEHSKRFLCACLG